ncbi:MAG TPA: recombinase family protein [Thermoanaerobaculia bacterium]|nr:recombinase family protein [Thermoanaerobaculia bacterium]
MGQVPFGYRLASDGVHLEEDEAEQATLADLATMRAAGWSWRRIAEELNARGVTTKTGKRWTWQTTRKTALSNR